MEQRAELWVQIKAWRDAERLTAPRLAAEAAAAVDGLVERLEASARRAARADCAASSPAAADDLEVSPAVAALALGELARAARKAARGLRAAFEADGGRHRAPGDAALREVRSVRAGESVGPPGCYDPDRAPTDAEVACFAGFGAPFRGDALHLRRLARRVRALEGEIAAVRGYHDPDRGMVAELRREADGLRVELAEANGRAAEAAREVVRWRTEANAVGVLERDHRNLAGERGAALRDARLALDGERAKRETLAALLEESRVEVVELRESVRDARAGALEAMATIAAAHATEDKGRAAKLAALHHDNEEARLEAKADRERCERVEAAAAEQRADLRREVERAREVAALSDRWEAGFRNVAGILLGPRVGFEIPDIVEHVRRLAVDAAARTGPAGGEGAAAKLSRLAELEGRAVKVGGPDLTTAVRVYASDMLARALESDGEVLLRRVDARTASAARDRAATSATGDVASAELGRWEGVTSAASVISCLPCPRSARPLTE